jgi:hypothetical protein
VNRYEIARRLILESDLIRVLIRAGREVPLAMRMAHIRTNKEYDRAR